MKLKSIALALSFVAVSSVVANEEVTTDVQATEVVEAAVEVAKKAVADADAQVAPVATEQAATTETVVS